MRYSTEPKFRKYVKGYGFLSFAKKFGDKYGKKLIDTAIKTGIDAAKTASKRVVQKTGQATGDLIENKVPEKITSVGKSKEKEKIKKVEEIYIPPKKILNYWWSCIKMEFQKIANLFDTAFDDKDLPRILTEKWIEVYDHQKKLQC